MKSSEKTKLWFITYCYCSLWLLMLAACQEFHYISVYYAYHHSTPLKATSPHPGHAGDRKLVEIWKKKLWGEKFNNDIFQLVTQRKSLIISFLRDSIQFPVVSWNERKKKYFHNFYRQVKNDTKFWLWFKKKEKKNNFVINHDGTYL